MYVIVVDVMPDLKINVINSVIDIVNIYTYICNG